MLVKALRKACVCLMFLGLYTIQTERKHTHNTVISPHGRSPSVMDWARFVHIAGKALSMNRNAGHALTWIA